MCSLRLSGRPLDHTRIFSHNIIPLIFESIADTRAYRHLYRLRESSTGIAVDDRNKSVDATLAAVTPSDDQAWYQKSNMVSLNLCLFSLLQLSSGNGCDGPMLNGVVTL